jgi:hypothetical protein
VKMRNKIACSAERLGLLDTQMIQSVAETNAFHIGSQYVTENRVRIVEADDAQISAAVIGNSGLYEQTIRLKDGHLISKCSCTLPESPMCRHSIAVLLEYHRWTQPRHSQNAKPAKVAEASPDPDSASDEHASTRQAPAPDVKLSEIMLFVEWLQPAMKAIEKGAVIPEPPPLSAGDVSTWITNITNLESRRRASEEVLMNLESEMRDREAYLGRLSQQLRASIAEAKAAQATSHTLQREVAGYREVLAHVAELVGKVVQYEGEIRTAASELMNKTTHLDKLTGAFHELADSLKSAAKQGPLK